VHERVDGADVVVGAGLREREAIGLVLIEHRRRYAILSIGDCVRYLVAVRPRDGRAHGHPQAGGPERKVGDVDRVQSGARDGCPPGRMHRGHWHRRHGRCGCALRRAAG